MYVSRKFETVKLLVLITTVVFPTVCSKEDRHSQDAASQDSSRRPSRDASDPYEDVSTMTTQVGGCGTCRMREVIRSRSLQAIKEQVLQSMGYRQAPNTTGLQLPVVPQHMLEIFGVGTGGYVQGMQGDEPRGRPFTPGFEYTDEEDNLHVKTEKIITFAQPCKCNYFVFFIFVFLFSSTFYEGFSSFFQFCV